MKNILTLFISIFTLFLFNSISVKAESGICVIKQQSNEYEVELPFFWYKVSKVITSNNNMQFNVSYNYTTTYVDTGIKCKSINNSVPETIFNGLNTSNSTTTTFHYSKQGLDNGADIFIEGSKQFKNSILPEDLTITSTFISIEDDLPPIISNETINPTIITTLENAISVSYLKRKLTAYDEVDGIIEIKIHEDNYTGHSNTLGTYTVTFSATDNSDNTSYLTITIVVKDTKKPTISGNKNITSNMSNPLTTKQIKDSLIVKDNYYIIENSSINIHKDNYTGNEQKEGIFTISFKVSDPSDNVSDEFVVNVSTYDDIPPKIKGESTYEISYKTLLDINDLSRNLVLNDNIDKNPIIQLLNDDYSSNYFKIGIYQVSFIAKDKNGNTSSPYLININVKDLKKPTIYISQKFIGVDGNALINIEDIIEIIETNNNISTNNLVSFDIVKDEYSANKTKPGQYIVELNYEYENGDRINVETKIIVDSFNETTKKEQIKDTPKKTFWSVIKDFFLKIWKFIKFIFSFKWIKD